MNNDKPPTWAVAFFEVLYRSLCQFVSGLAELLKDWR